ncbi:hypothetical protein CsSME_00015095 [Camellia sinensis var. sinensis]
MKALSGWRDELRKDIEQLCMQQAGPGYLAVATRMHFQRYSNRYSFIMPGALHHYYFDGCEAWHGRAQGFFDWLSRQLSGLSNFPVAVNLNYVLFQFVILDGCDL